MGGIDDIIDQSANSRTLAPAAVGSQVALMTLISGITIIVFNVLRPRNKIVYEPKVKYHEGDKQPPRISDSIFGWISPLVHTKEPVLVEKIGLDAAIYLRFLRMMRWIFTCVALLTSAALIPINIVNSLKNSKKHDDLSVLTIRDVSGDILFVHVAVTYLICFIVMGFVWFNWRAVIKLRSEWFRSPEYVKSFYARTLMITGVSRKLQSDEGLRAIFQSTQAPYPTTAVHIGRQVGKLPDLIEYHNEAVRELEKVLVKYLKNGRIGKQRPTVRVNGFMCFGGQKKDAIEFWTAKVQRAERAVEEYRNQIDTRKPEPYGFASMAAVPYAHTVANMLRNKRVKGATITLAPNPKDIIWMNLNATSGELASKKATGWIFLVLVCFFNTIPLFIISILANLASLTAFVPFLASWQSSSPGTFDFLSGVLPPAVSALFGFFLPILMRWLSKYQGAITHSRLDRAVIARYFAFLVISQLIIFTLIGVIFNSVREIVEQIGEHKSFQDIINNLHRLPDTINRTYIDQSSYWLTYFPLRGFLVFFDLAQIFNLLFISFKKHFLGRTPREIREWTQPPEFQYAIYYSNILFMGTVGLVFAPLAPLVCIAAAIVMWISSWVYKYQLMFVFVTRVETGGRLWNVIVNRLFVGVILMQLLMVLTIGLQKGWTSYYWISTIPPVLIVLGFKIYCTRVFNPRFNYYQPTPDELSVAQRLASQSESSGNNSRLSKRFGHPALHQELFTPMVHANMTALLPEVYRGKISNTSTKLDEYGGTKVDASMVAGIKIAAIEQHDLEYDPALYSRDRGELDWDARSVNSVNLLAPSKSEYGGYGGRASPAPSTIANYDKYLAQGPHSEIELNRMDIDQLPLLTSQQGMPWASASSASVGSLPYQPPMRESPPPVPYIPQTQEYTEATLHRPYPTGQTGYPPPQPLQQHQQQPSGEMNMAGRGARRNMY